MEKRNKILFLFLGILFISLTLVSSQGLVIVGDNTININKTNGIDKSITLNLQNQESYSFYNVSIETNSYVSSSKILEIPSGQSKNITLNFQSNNDFNGELRIKGVYKSQLGMLNETHNIDVNYNSGLSRCDFSIVQGDNVIWKNTHPYAIVKLINANTYSEITQLSPNQTYSEKFQTPMSFRYYFERYGIKFTDVCTISVLDTSGSINNPDYDVILHLNLKILYPSTNLIITILDRNYTISPFNSGEDFLKIKNNGTSIAKNIHLSGEWFSFSDNNFDLNGGESKTIKYTITPQITNTNQTNKNYTKNIEISGNLETKTESFTISIPYQIINEGVGGGTSLLERVQTYAEVVISYCNDNPDEEFCDNLFKTIVVGSQGNQSTPEIELFKAFIDFMDKQEQQNALMKRSQDLVVNSTLNAENRTTSIENQLDEIDKQNNRNNVGNIFFSMTILFIFVCGGLIFFIRHYKKKNTQKSKERFV